ncbi:hypothetical protein DKZ22_10640 [Limosilactobacillus reuteri]|uniref:Uncharacterized protein n=2 Tax=Limosilactobacillus reuteri TaxID=1598 RepID=A0A317GPF8_LIMRT|nr:hypothetical protein [Limosilactobacillus reuteri]PWT34064.1 hypothetical protein DKZ21_00245 [Limosilactobacillus reuteri]PWT37488.1 hypothetical protein DKZ35_05125 [Limosilactobacillus reuteri]PWT39599.1 hypothetical protein DKZ22_10640 [Limosilactobacillus reuteri]PWT45496.1 hypothetical protein DKZ25_00245 [Limosilactobacillus reuteri]PWT55710.1 hypothetical protein DKZ31_01055 [Limosilactobacillus reuteri]
MNNQQQQSDKAEKVASKLINKLALAELELVNREVDIDELNARIQQLTQANQQLSDENQLLKSKQETKTEE